MISIWIAIGIVAALGVATVYACIVAGSDADDESERWEETRRKEEDENEPRNPDRPSGRRS